MRKIRVRSKSIVPIDQNRGTDRQGGFLAESGLFSVKLHLFKTRFPEE